MMKLTGTMTKIHTALNGYYSFDNGPSISAGYEFGDIGGAAATADESINYFVGIHGMKLVQENLVLL